MLRAAVLVELLHVGVLVGVVQLLPLHVEERQLVHVMDHLVADTAALTCLLQRILVSMYLTEDGAVLQLQLAQDEHLTHPVRDALLLEVDKLGR